MSKACWGDILASLPCFQTSAVVAYLSQWSLTLKIRAPKGFPQSVPVPWASREGDGQQAVCNSSASAASAARLAEVQGAFSLSFWSLSVCKSSINLGSLSVLVLCLCRKEMANGDQWAEGSIQDHQRGGRIWTGISQNLMVFLTTKASCWLKDYQDGFSFPPSEMPDLLIISGISLFFAIFCPS